MKKVLILTFVIIGLTFSIFFIGCKKNDTPTPEIKEMTLNDNTLIVSKDISTNTIISVDSTKLTFTSSGTGVDRIKVGSILVSDISTIAPDGFLRKVTSITTSNGNKIFETEQASLADAIVNGSVNYSKTFSDNDIISEDSSGVDISLLPYTKSATQLGTFSFTYKKPIYDYDKNLQTTYDQVRLEGSMKIEPTLDFEVVIENGRIKKFLTKISVKNTNTIKAVSDVTKLSLKEEIVLKTFQLKPFTVLIWGFPVPIAKQWIAIILGVDGGLSAKITAGAVNINTAKAGIIYENNLWSTINTQDNSLSILPLTFEGAAKIEPWIQMRYEIRPYGLESSRIFIGVRGSEICESTVIPTGLSTTLKWGVKFNAKAQMQIFDKAVLDYEKVFYEQEFPFYQKSTFAFPSLTTTALTNITQTTASSGGNVTSDGGATVTTRGVCWSTTQIPTTSNFKTTDGSGVNTFTSNLTNLTANTTYYVRAYATNSAGTAYGSQISFPTSNPINYGSVSDVDGNTYKTVAIGQQVWMAENLKTTKYRNGDAIPNVTEDAAWAVLSTGAYCWNKNDAPTNKATYGALYNWYSVADSRNIAPTGWHVATDAEWTTLTTFLGGEGVAGDKLKETGNSHYYIYNTGATNETGFTAVPGGYKLPYSNSFQEVGFYGYWWTSTESYPLAWCRYMSSEFSDVVRLKEGKQMGFSVRCVRD